MHRPYRPQDFREIVMEIHGRFPQAAIGLDVLTGFPTETCRDFEETLALLAVLPVTYLHVFPYSPRPGTAAASLQPLPAGEVKARAARLRKRAQEKKVAFLASQVGRVEEVLIERADARLGWLTGLSANYLRVRLPGPPAWRNRRLPVRLVRTEGEILVGEAVQE
jgi:threonylcarbamoyladenosine tRNA methylthiotransferase MtaB